mmetsp:Transcript_29289/g.86757  ORF Transcript_29289/g.86757 Transcript_29289/m.86757 type:complete len:329 (-) Transcript_29289:152-1138(-)
MRRPISNSAVLIACYLARGYGFVPDVSPAKISKGTWVKRDPRVSCLMAVTPIGPFCPFRSDAAVAVEPRMEGINTATPEFATEMARLQLDMQSGVAPDPERLRKVADGIESAVDEWENLLARLKLSNDFQTREYAKLTQAHLSKHGQTSDEIAVMMRWQSGCMRAMAENRPPPMPPANVDIMKMMQDAQGNSNSGSTPPSIAAMTTAEKITSAPFSEESTFESDTVREEYEKLCRDHNALIQMGASYATFDPMGKIAFLDEIKKVEERWDIFFARFSLLGQLDKSFINQCNAFLESMGLDEQQFKELLKETHKIMREDAEKERNTVGY